MAAPGADIESTGLKSGYRRGTGTSDASAIVAGAAALVRSKYPDLSATEVVERLESTADDKGTPGLDDQYGHGVVNLVAALSAPAGSAQPSADPSATAASPAPTADSSAGGGAAPDAPASSNGLLVFGGVLVVVVLVAGLVGFFTLRRRKGP
jgi:subtilisin family serine protease